MTKKLFLAITVLALPTHAGAAVDTDANISISKSEFINFCRNNVNIDKRCKAALASLPAPASHNSAKLASGSTVKGPVDQSLSQGLQLPTLSAPLADRFGCKPNTKALFARSDALDNFNYLLDLPSGLSASNFNASQSVTGGSGGNGSPPGNNASAAGTSAQSPNAAARAESDHAAS